jgi:Fe-S cluster assembly protein SufD
MEADVKDVAATRKTVLDRFVESLAGTHSGEPMVLAALRRRGREAYAANGLPTPRHEDWRFTNLRPVEATEWATIGPIADAALRAAVASRTFDHAHRLVFVNGRLVPELGRFNGLPSGVIVTSLANLAAEQPELVRSHLGALAAPETSPIGALNAAGFVDGAAVILPKGAVVEAPIHLMFATSPNGRTAAVFPRVLVIAGENSQATVVESYLGTAGRSLTAPVTEIAVGDGAVVDHYRVQEESRDAYHVAVHAVRQGRSSTFSSHAVNLGGALARNDVSAELLGEGADCILNGLYVVDGTQHVDTSMRVRHAVPHCTSHELYKGILDGGAHGVFTGRIVVDPDAQKTDAKQTNRNLLLSPTALVNSNPQLEIFANDVKCTHGSTIGRLDEDAVFYLRSRGLDRTAAESLLTWAFASDIVARIKVAPVRRALEEFLIQRLPQGELVREAF